MTPSPSPWPSLAAVESAPTASEPGSTGEPRSEKQPLPNDSSSGSGNKQARVAELEADVQRLEDVLQRREAQYAKEVEAARAEAESRVRAEVAEAAGSLTAMIDRVVSERQRLYDDAETIVLQLSIVVARRILGDAVRVDRNAVLEVVRRALETVREQETIRLHVHPDDLELVRQHESEWVDSVTARRFSFEPDGRVDPGGCLIRTDSGDVDARISRQLETIAGALVEAPE